MEKLLRVHLLTLAARYIASTGCGLSTLARRCRHDSGFFVRLQKTDRSFTVRTFDRVQGWFDQNWPEGCDWPEDMARPLAETDAPCLTEEGSQEPYSRV